MRIHSAYFEHPIALKPLLWEEDPLDVVSEEFYQQGQSFAPVLVLTYTLLEEGVNLSNLLDQMEQYDDYGIFSKIILRIYDKIESHQDVTHKKEIKKIKYRHREVTPYSNRSSLTPLKGFAEYDVNYAKSIFNQKSLTKYCFKHKKSKESSIRPSHQTLDKANFQILMTFDKCSENNLNSEVLGIFGGARTVVVLPIGNMGEGKGGTVVEPYASHVSKLDFLRIIQDLNTSSQIMRTYLLPKLCPMFERTDNQAATALSMVLLLMHVYLCVYDWVRATCVPYLSLFLRYLGQGSGRLVFIHQYPTIWAQHLVHTPMLQENSFFSLSEYYYKNKFHTLNKGSFYTYGWSTRPSTINHYQRSLMEWNWNSPTSIFTYIFLVVFLLFIIQFQLLIGGPLDYISRVMDITFTYKFGWFKILAYFFAWLGYPSIMMCFGLIVNCLFVFMDPVYYHNRILLTLLKTPGETVKKTALKRGTTLKSYSNFIYTLLISSTFGAFIFVLPLIVCIMKLYQLLDYLMGLRKKNRKTDYVDANDPTFSDLENTETEEEAAAGKEDGAKEEINKNVGDGDDEF